MNLEVFWPLKLMVLICWSEILGLVLDLCFIDLIFAICLQSWLAIKLLIKWFVLMILNFWSLMFDLFLSNVLFCLFRSFILSDTLIWFPKLVLRSDCLMWFIFMWLGDLTSICFSDSFFVLMFWSDFADLLCKIRGIVWGVDLAQLVQFLRWFPLSDVSCPSMFDRFSDLTLVIWFIWSCLVCLMYFWFWFCWLDVSFLRSGFMVLFVWSDVVWPELLFVLFCLVWLLTCVSLFDSLGFMFRSVRLNWCAWSYQVGSLFWSCLLVFWTLYHWSNWLSIGMLNLTFFDLVWTRYSLDLNFTCVCWSEFCVLICSMSKSDLICMIWSVLIWLLGTEFCRGCFGEVVQRALCFTLWHKVGPMLNKLG